MATDKWERLGGINLRWHGTLAVVMEGRIYVPSGGVKQGRERRAGLALLRLARWLS